MDDADDADFIFSLKWWNDVECGLGSIELRVWRGCCIRLFLSDKFVGKLLCFWEKTTKREVLVKKRGILIGEIRVSGRDL